MSYRCEILADSISPDGHRLTTFEVTFPRIVLADYTRHRMLSYSFESTRAVPLERRLEMVKENPFIPDPFRSRAKGMGGGETLDGDNHAEATDLWLDACASAIDAVEMMEPEGDWPGVSKELAGRLLEPFSWITGIISGTEWENFFGLRCPPIGAEPDPKYPAQYELQVIASLQRDLYQYNEPERLAYGEWHLPLVSLDEYTPDADRYWAHVSAGRCATVSYLNQHKDSANTTDKAYERWNEKLAPSAHWSPGEHPAQCVIENDGTSPRDLGNFNGWKQLRKFYTGEAIREPIYQFV